METVARDFYPFVEKEASTSTSDFSDNVFDGEVQHPARIAVYDDAAAAPRVVVVEPTDVRTYLEEITATVNKLSHEQGGNIPFMVIREIVENFIHAYFQSPTITILDGGNTIRFSDQGPGIKEKDLALEYGTSSATEGMKKFIRGVGSGLPYAQQYMQDKGGSLEIEDNLGGGTVVTISTRPAGEARDVSGSQRTEEVAPQASAQPWQQPIYQSTGYPQAAMQQPYAQQGFSPQPVYQGQPWLQQPYQPGYQQAYQQQPYQQQAYQQPQAAAPMGVQLDERQSQVMSYLAAHESCGPTELTQAFGSSGPTWSRVLSNLSNMGLLTKAGQKYRPTTIGRAYL